MTYSQMKKKLKQIDDQIKFLYELQEMAPNTTQKIFFGRIVDNLCDYRAYLKYEKEYIPKVKEKDKDDIENITG